MKILCKLPDSKLFRVIAPSEAWYRWEDKSSSRIRLLSKVADPWRQPRMVLMPHFAMSKADKSEFPTRLHFKIYPEEEGIQEGNLVREIFKGNVVHTNQPTLFFSAVQLESDSLVPLWLAYSIVANEPTEIPKPPESIQPTLSSAPGNWILYRNDVGMPGRVVGLFSNPEKAMKCKVIRGLIGFAEWHKRNDYLWLCKPEDKAYYFSVEYAIIDRLEEE